MKKIFSLFICFMFSGFVFCAENVDDLYEDNPVYAQVDYLLNADFSGSSLNYNNFDEIKSLAFELPLEVREYLYEEHSRSVALYTGLNVLLPGLGSVIQGDVYGGVTSLVLYEAGVTVLSIGVSTALFTEMVWLFGSVLSAPTGASVVPFVDTPVFKTGVALSVVGAGIMVGTCISSLFRPSLYSKAYNSQLSKVLGVSKADFAVLPYVSPDVKTGGVSLSLAINF